MKLSKYMSSDTYYIRVNLKVSEKTHVLVGSFSLLLAIYNMEGVLLHVVLESQFWWIEAEVFEFGQETVT